MRLPRINKAFNYFFLIFVPQFICTLSFAQVEDIESLEWYEIYNNNGLRIKVIFDVPSPSELCYKPVTFQYKYLGDLLPNEAYAEWSLKYLDCGGVTKEMTAYAPLSRSCNGMENSEDNEEFHFKEMDEIITSKKLIELNFSNKKQQQYLSPNVKEIHLDNSFAPERIVASTNVVKPGEELIIKVEGGALGKNAKWKVYNSNCGVGLVTESVSREIKVFPSKSTSYYVRAEGMDTTLCQDFSISVDLSSKMPDVIKGPSVICEGAKLSLEQEGGELGPDSDYYWYEGACGSKKLIGKGTSITVEPKENSVYFVRTESNDHTIVSPTCISKEVKVARPPKDIKFSIIDKNESNGEICEGTEIVLEAKGELVEGAYWVWMENNKRIKEKVNEIVRTPKENTVYKLQMYSEGCGTSEEYEAIEISVYQKSKAPTELKQVFDGKNKKNSKLLLIGGKLADKSDWVYYYKSSDKSGKEVKNEVYRGKEETITVEKKWSDKQIYVVAEGTFCNDNTNPTSIKLEQQESTKVPSQFALRYSQGKWFHFGVLGGFDYLILQDSLQDEIGVLESKEFNIESNIGYLGFELHPIFKDEFSMGINAGYGIFAKNYNNLRNTFSQSSTSELHFGKGNYFNWGIEMGWTISREGGVKMIMNYNKRLISNDLRVEYYGYDSLGNYSQNGSFVNNSYISLDRLTIAFRFGSYNRKGAMNKRGNPKLGAPFDINLSLLGKNNQEDANAFMFNSFRTIGDWQVGFGINWWIFNVMRIGIDWSSQAKIGTLFAESSSYNQYSLTARLAYNFDLFR